MTYNVFGGTLNLTQFQLHVTIVTAASECEKVHNGGIV